MSTGIPVVSTKISGIPELIKDNVNGFLAEPDDPVDLSYKIEEALNAPKEELEKIVKNARLKIETEFNNIKLTEELKNLILSIN